MADVLHRTTKELKLSVNTPDYPSATWIINPTLAGLYDRPSRTYLVPVKYWNIVGDVVSEMSPAEKSAVDEANLDAYKSAKCSEIDNKTQQLIEAGFEYPALSGVFFSLSHNAQRSLLATDNIKDEPSLSYPLKWNSKDDKNETDLATSADMRTFFLTAQNTVRGHIDSGTALKSSVRAATTIAQVDLVVDNR